MRKLNKLNNLFFFFFCKNNKGNSYETIQLLRFKLKTIEFVNYHCTFLFMESYDSINF